MTNSPFFVYLVCYLLLAGKGEAPPDLVTLIEPEHYFHSRQLTVSPDQMEGLARTDPTDGRKQVAQLLAIRWLGEHGVQPARATLSEIAEGRLPQDEHGFAREYARRALARLDGRAFAPDANPNRGIHEALRWLPDDVARVWAVDLTVPWGDGPFVLRPSSVTAAGGEPVPPVVLRLTTLFECERESVYRWAEEVGNFRVERAVLAMRPPSASGRQGAFMRLSGRGHHQRLVDGFRRSLGCTVMSDEIGPAGERITLMRGDDPGITLAGIGDTDIILANDPDFLKREGEAVEDVLRVRAGRKRGLLQGKLNADLREIPENAIALWVGDLSEAEQQEITQQHGLPVAPRHIISYAIPDAGKGVRVHFRARMGSPEEAQSFLESCLRSLDTLRLMVNDLPPSPSAEVVKQVIQSATVEAHEASVSGEFHLMGHFPAALGEVAESLALQDLGKALEPALSRASKQVLAWSAVALIVLAALGVGALTALRLAGRKPELTE